MKNKILLAAGLAAPILYFGTVVLGAALRSDYSHVSNAISELILADSPNHNLINGLFLVYNILCLAGAIGLLRNNLQTGQRKQLAAAYALGIVALAGIAMTLFFPQDPRGSSPTITGIMHLVTAGIESLGLMAAMILIGLALRTIPARRAFSSLTFVLFILVFLSGGASAIFIESPYMGILERTVIGISLLWQSLFYWNELKFTNAIPK